MTATQSWIEAANRPECDFPLQNLPFCAFRYGADQAHLGIGIGDQIFDLALGINCPALSGLTSEVRSACAGAFLNDLMRCRAADMAALRQALLQLFSVKARQEDIAAATPLLSPIATAQFRLPVSIANYTDFYASIQHATNVGRLFRPDQPLLPNYKFVPIGYHGRASSVQLSGTSVVRPWGQLKAPDAAAPSFAPCRQLDYELEVGAYVRMGNQLGQPIDIADAPQRLFGLSLLNDWSARDIQSWEYQPLGPFLSKSFLTSVSPWVVPMEALEPYRVRPAARPDGDPMPLPYLAEASANAYDIQVEVSLLTQAMRDAGAAPVRLTTGNMKDLYWTFAQMLTHHASNGCNLMPGDLIGSGTISSEGKASAGSLLELTYRGSKPLSVGDAETRIFLDDGDEVIFHGFCQRPGQPRIGFGECRGTVLAARRGPRNESERR